MLSGNQMREERTDRHEKNVKPPISSIYLTLWDKVFQLRQVGGFL
jgi:hypothetical protein